MRTNDSSYSDENRQQIDDHLELLDEELSACRINQSALLERIQKLEKEKEQMRLLWSGAGVVASTSFSASLRTHTISIDVGKGESASHAHGSSLPSSPKPQPSGVTDLVVMSCIIIGVILLLYMAHPYLKRTINSDDTSISSRKNN